VLPALPVCGWLQAACARCGQGTVVVGTASSDAAGGFGI